MQFFLAFYYILGKINNTKSQLVKSSPRKREVEAKASGLQHSSKIPTLIPPEF
ncbi:hypothetical protein NIES25_52020 [Nostoc linckia NIES-25]|nr:hypothetical protein NIES25_52020 [Nostoc linckia NIES-25]